MADGFARASGRPGITMAQIVGGLNLAAGLRDAHLAGSPVIAFTGGYDPMYRYRHDYQEAEDFDAFESVTKFNAYIDDVRRFPDLIRQAFRTATTGNPGPVHLRLRGKLGQIEEEAADLEVLAEEQFSRYPPFRPEPQPEHVRQVAKALAFALAAFAALASLALWVWLVRVMKRRHTIRKIFLLLVSVGGIASRCGRPVRRASSLRSSSPSSTTC